MLNGAFSLAIAILTYGLVLSSVADNGQQKAKTA